MKSQIVEVGTLVRVNQNDRNPNLRGQVGTVTHRYGSVSYAAFDVLFSNGCSELFWHYEVEKTNLPSIAF
jgi:hypothetical protein